MAHQNSIAALRQEDALRNASYRAGRILAAAQASGSRQWTDREMAIALGFVEMNAVRPRITEMVKAGILVETGSTPCPVTGKTVRLWRAATCEEMAEHIPQPVAPTGLQTELALA